MLPVGIDLMIFIASLLTTHITRKTKTIELGEIGVLIAGVVRGAIRASPKRQANPPIRWVSGALLSWSYADYSEAPLVASAEGSASTMDLAFPSIMEHSRAMALAIYSWWDDVNSSGSWQEGVFYTLCAAYALVGAVALIQLGRIELRVPEYGWTTQKVFHLMNFIVNAARALVFGFYKNVFDFNIRIFSSVLLDFPGLLFFSTYTLLVLFWAEIYHQARSLPTDKLRPGFLVMNVLIYVLQIIIWVYEWLSYNAVSLAVARLFFAAVSFFAAAGFLLYGGRLFLMLRRFPLESKGRRKKLREVGLVTAICFMCFIIRTVVVATSAFEEDADLDVLDHPILNLIYYLLVEILPSALVLFILRKLPPKRPSAQYHTIH